MSVLFAIAIAFVMTGQIAAGYTINAVLIYLALEIGLQESEQ